MMSLVYRIFNSSLFRASGIYTITSIINAGIPFLLLPILTRYLSPEEYGIVAMFSLLVSIFGVFTGLSVHGAINRVYFEKEIKFKEYVANCVFILVISSTLVFSFAFIFREFISLISGVPKNWVLVAVILSFFQFLILSILAIYQARMRAKEYSFIQIGQSFLSALLTIFLIVILGLKWEGRLLAQFFAIFSFGIFSFILLNKYWTEWRFNIDYIKHALKFGIPLIPHATAGMFMVATDRFIIKNLLGLKDAGIYTAGLQIGMIIHILTTSFNRAYGPWLFEKLNKNDEQIKIKIVKFTYLYFILILGFAIVFGLFSEPLVKIMLGRDFVSSSEVVFWIALGNSFDGMYYMVVNYIFYAYKTYILAWITFFGGLFNVIVTFILTKINGIVGAAQAYAITLFITFILVWLLSAKVYKMPWRLR